MIDPTRAEAWINLAIVEEQECTAVVKDGEPPPHLLFTPPCSCPRCAPEITYDPIDARRWLRLSGHQQRYRVEQVELGETGKQMLG